MYFRIVVNTPSCTISGNGGGGIKDKALVIDKTDRGLVRGLVVDLTGILDKLRISASSCGWIVL